MELLKSTALTITEIADACGFSGAGYFTEMFTRQKGGPPEGVPEKYVIKEYIVFFSSLNVMRSVTVVW